MLKGRLIFLIILLIANTCYSGEVDTTRAVIHHTDSHDVSVKTIDKWHKERGWDGIGYHFCIREDGRIESGRDIRKKGAHARGRNHYVGIALTGNGSFTSMQIESLKILCKRIGITHLERHHEKCPGKNLNVEQIEREINVTQISKKKNNK